MEVNYDGLLGRLKNRRLEGDKAPETEAEKYAKKKDALFETLRPKPVEPTPEPANPIVDYDFLATLSERNARVSRQRVQKALDDKLNELKKEKLHNTFKGTSEIPAGIPLAHEYIDTPKDRLLTVIQEKLKNPENMKSPRFDRELAQYLSKKNPDVSITLLDAEGLKLASAQKAYSGSANINYLWGVREKIAQLGTPILFAKANQGNERIAILSLQEYGINGYIAVAGNPDAVESVQKELSYQPSSIPDDKQIRNHTKFGWIHPQKSGLKKLHTSLAESEYDNIDIRTKDSRILLNKKMTGTQYWIAGASPITLEDDLCAVHACAAPSLAKGAMIAKVNDRIAYKEDGRYHVAPADQLQDVYVRIYQTPMAMATAAFTPYPTAGTKTPLTGKWELNKAETVLHKDKDCVDFFEKNVMRRIEKAGKVLTCTEYRV